MYRQNTHIYTCPLLIPPCTFCSKVQKRNHTRETRSCFRVFPTSTPPLPIFYSVHSFHHSLHLSRRLFSHHQSHLSTVTPSFHLCLNVYLLEDITSYPTLVFPLCFSTLLLRYTPLYPSVSPINSPFLFKRPSFPSRRVVFSVVQRGIIIALSKRVGYVTLCMCVCLYMPAFVCRCGSEWACVFIMFLGKVQKVLFTSWLTWESCSFNIIRWYFSRFSPVFLSFSDLCV